MLAMVIEQAKAQKEREVQLYLSYNREATIDSKQPGASEGAQVYAAMGKQTGKAKRETRLKGDERRTGKKMQEPTRIVSAAKDGIACHKRLDEIILEEKEEMIHPMQVDQLEAWTQEFVLEEPYPGARYAVAACHDYSQEAQTPSGSKDPYGRFVGRKVRKYFEINNLKHRHRLQAVEGVVERYLKGKSLFRIRYDTNGSDADREDLDLAALELARAKTVGQDAMGRQTCSQIAERLALVLSHGLPADHVERCLARAAELDGAVLQQAARRWLSQPSLSLVGPAPALASATTAWEAAGGIGLSRSRTPA
jgi:hypothetical protein